MRARGSRCGSARHHPCAGNPSCGYGYTSITFVKDRVLLTYYENPAPLVFDSVPLDWFYGR